MGVKALLSGSAKGVVIKAVAGVVALGCVGAVAAVAGPSLVSAATGTASATASATTSAAEPTSAASAAASTPVASRSVPALQRRPTLSQPGLRSPRPAPQPVPTPGPTSTAAVPVGVDVGLVDEGCRASGNPAAPYHLTFTAVFSDGHHMSGLSVDSTSSSVDEVYVSYGGRSMFQVATGADFTC